MRPGSPAGLLWCGPAQIQWSSIGHTWAVWRALHTLVCKAGLLAIGYACWYALLALYYFTEQDSVAGDNL